MSLKIQQWLFVHFGAQQLQFANIKEIKVFHSYKIYGITFLVFSK